jgi:hypothetical protein
MTSSNRSVRRSYLKHRSAVISLCRATLNHSTLWALVPLALTACLSKEAPDPYYLQINDVRLAVPKAYANSGFGFEVAGNRNEIRALAAKKPGFALDSFSMYLNGSDLTVRDKSKSDIGTPDGLRLFIFSPNALPRSELAGAVAARFAKAEGRSPKDDIDGLVAYRVSWTTDKGDMKYVGQNPDGTSMAIHCAGFNMPRPTCVVDTMWKGLALRYDYSHMHFAQWRAMHSRVTGLLNSFVYL